MPEEDPEDSDDSEDPEDFEDPEDPEDSEDSEDSDDPDDSEDSEDSVPLSPPARDEPVPLDAFVRSVVEFVGRSVESVTDSPVDIELLVPVSPELSRPIAATGVTAISPTASATASTDTHRRLGSPDI